MKKMGSRQQVQITGMLGVDGGWRAGQEWAFGGREGGDGGWRMRGGS